MKTTPEQRAELKRLAELAQPLPFDADGKAPYSAIREFAACVSPELVTDLLADLEEMQATIAAEQLMVQVLRHHRMSDQFRIAELERRLAFTPSDLSQAEMRIAELQARIAELLEQVTQLEIAANNRSVSNNEASALYALGAERSLVANLQSRLADAEKDAARWQPIETAPQTGRTILLGYLNSHGHWRTMRGQWFSKEEIAETWEEAEACEELEGWYETSEEADDIPNCWATEPTHWMPVPKAPDCAIAAGKETND